MDSIESLLSNAGDTMSAFREKLLKKRIDWIMHAQSKDYILPPLDAALANLWLYHHAGERERRKSAPAIVDPDGTLQAFIDESLSGVDTMDVWSKREHCSGCYETYKLENMVTCTLCHRSICWRCEVGNVGENICSCGGEMY